MAIDENGIAPYAPSSAVIGAIEFHRNKTLPNPVTQTVLERIGVKPSLAPRTLQALKLLDLIDESGAHTDSLTALGRAPSDSYKAMLGEFLQAAYAPIFRYADPANDPTERIADAFRIFTPGGMRPRMLTLFLDLGAYAGILPERDRRRGPKPRSANGTTTAKATHSGAQRKTAEPLSKIADNTKRVAIRRPDSPAAPMAASDHLLIQGIIGALPPVGSEWSDEDRTTWTEAALSNFNLVYRRPKISSTKGVDNG